MQNETNDTTAAGRDMDALIEQAVRQAAAQEGGAGPMTALVKRYDELVAAAADQLAVYRFHLDPATKKISIIETTVEEAALVDLDDEGEAEAAPTTLNIPEGYRPVFLDELDSYGVEEGA